MGDLAERLTNRVQISSDALGTYVDAVEQAFGADVDYGQIVKFYEAVSIGQGRYSPPQVVRTVRTVVAGSPDQSLISTSLVERQNLTMRMSMRRFTRLTNAFSKNVENLSAAVAVHFAHYNLVRVHKTLRVTPAMAARVADRLWSLEEWWSRLRNEAGSFPVHGSMDAGCPTATGMGYTVVRVTLTDGRRFDQVIVDSGYLGRVRGMPNVPFSESDIAETTATHEKWNLAEKL